MRVGMSEATLTWTGFFKMSSWKLSVKVALLAIICLDEGSLEFMNLISSAKDSELSLSASSNINSFIDFVRKLPLSISDLIRPGAPIIM